MAGTGSLHLRASEDALLRVEDLVVEFPSGRGTVHAVSGISFDILPGETLGLVGESGCGKSTTGKAVIQLPRPTSGRVLFDGADLAKVRGSRLRRLRTRFQLIFQDPISSLNPRRTVRSIVSEPLRIWSRTRKWSSPSRWLAVAGIVGLAYGLVLGLLWAAGGAPPPLVVVLLSLAALAALVIPTWPKKVLTEDQQQFIWEILEAVGLDPDVTLDKRPHQFSGGQSQRISIARALVNQPQLIICDEPVSALDVSVQAQILNLLEDLKERYGLTLVFIAHDLAVVKNVSDRVAVMYLGKMCEIGPPDRLFSYPAHPYTAGLLKSIPVPDPQVRPSKQDLLEGDLPSPVSPPSGCRFRTRCPYAEERCATEEPQIRQVGPDHYVACHFPLSGGAAAPVPVEVAAGVPV